MWEEEFLPNFPTQVSIQAPLMWRKVGGFQTEWDDFTGALQGQSGKGRWSWDRPL